MKKVKLDRINQKILIALQKDARISNIELAERVALSPSACLQRVKALEDAGYIQGYVMNPDIDRLCQNVKSYVLITLKNNDFQSCSLFEKKFKEFPEVVDCLRVAGAIDYISLIMTSSIDSFNAFTDTILNMDIGIVRLDSHFIMSAPKWFGGYPMEKLDWHKEE